MNKLKTEKVDESKLGRIPFTWLGEPHSEILKMLRQSGVCGEIEYRQNCHMNFNVDMTVGRYCWHDDTDTKRWLFVLESYGNGKPKGS